jgi:diaminopimelate epimerase
VSDKSGEGSIQEYDFVKLQGLGNDFVFIDDLSLEIDFTKEQVQRICDRHFGVGADGVILVRPSQNPDCTAYMHYINADGTLAQMCGNGVRCFAKYLVDRGFVNAADGGFSADTLAGERHIDFEVDSDAKLVNATVDMGAPILDPTDVPVQVSPNSSYKDEPVAVDVALDCPWGDFKFTFVSMGNPHAVTFIDNFDNLPDELFKDPTEKSLATFDVDKVGSFFESHKVFPEKSNIEFATVEGDGIHMRVYERGCAETLACGTGACATNVAAALTGRAGRANSLHLLGGRLFIDWSENDHVLMTGPAKQSFEGTFIFE